MKFSIITPVYNAEEYIGRCIDSVLSQTYNNWELIIINDGSTDNTLQIILSYTKLNGKIKVLNIPSRRGTLSNHILGLKRATGDVIVHLDGDDWFITNQALEIVRNTYEQRGVLATYGNYTTTDGSSSVCRRLKYGESVRSTILSTGWPCSHLRTFRTSLIKHINAMDLFDMDGNILTAAPDVALLCSIYDYANREGGLDFIQTPLVGYNRDSVLNEDKVSMSDQVKSAISVATNKYI